MAAPTKISYGLPFEGVQQLKIVAGVRFTFETTEPITPLRFWVGGETFDVAEVIVPDKKFLLVPHRKR